MGKRNQLEGERKNVESEVRGMARELQRCSQELAKVNKEIAAQEQKARQAKTTMERVGNEANTLKAQQEQVLARFKRVSQEKENNLQHMANGAANVEPARQVDEPARRHAEVDQ